MNNSMRNIGLIIAATLILMIVPSVVLAQFDEPFENNTPPDSSTGPLDIVKGVDKVITTRGDTLLYSLSLTNNSEEIIYDVDVVDDIPQYVDYITGSATLGGLYDGAEERVSWKLESVSPRQTVRFYFEVTVEDNAPDSVYIRNRAVITSPDTAYSRYAISIVKPVLPCPNMEIAKLVDKTTAEKGEIINYTLQVWNRCPEMQYDIEVVDTLVPYSMFMQADNGGIYEPSGREVRWTIPEMSAYEIIYLHFSTRVDYLTPDSTEIANYATVTYPDEAVSDTVYTFIEPDTTEFEEELEIFKTVDRDSAFTGDTLYYELTVNNIGEVTARTINVIDDMPSNTSLIAGSVFGGDFYEINFDRINWRIDSLEPGQMEVLSFAVTVDGNTPDFSSIANIGYIVTPYVVPSNAVNTVVKPIPQPVLSLTKTADKDTAFVGDTIVYTLSVNNDGDGDASGVVITDHIPAYTTFIDGSISPGGYYDIYSNAVIWNVGGLAANSSDNLNFSVAINSDTRDSTEIVNFGFIDEPYNIISDTAVTVALIDTTQYEPDIAIDKSVSLDSAHVQDVLRYTLRVSNNGDGIGYGIEITDSIPRYTVLQNISAAGNGTYDLNINGVRWTVDSLLPGGSIDLWFEVMIAADTPDSTEIYNHAFSFHPDTAFSDTVMTLVFPDTTPQPELVLSKTVDRTIASGGDTLDYVITVNNIGEGLAEGVQVEDDIPAYTNYIVGSVQPSGLYDTGLNRLFWTVGDLEPGGSVDLSFSAVVDSTAPDSIFINNYALATNPDSVYSDTTATLIVADSLKPRPILGLSKSVDIDSAYAGDTLTYSLSVSNTGDTLAAGVNIIDSIPDFTTYIEGSSAAIHYTENNYLSWVIEVIEPGETVDLGFKVFINEDTPDSTIIKNYGFIDADSIIYSDTVETFVKPGEIPLEPELTIVKTVNINTANVSDTLTFDITIANVGDTLVENVVVYDTIPDYTYYVENSADHDAAYDAENRLLTWTIEQVDIEEIVNLSFKAVIDSDTPDSTLIRNTAFITEPDSLSSDTTLTIVKEEIEPDLTIVKEVDSVTAVVGSILTYTINVTNNLDRIELLMSIEDFVPAYTNLVAGSVSDSGIYNPQSRKITWIETLIRPQQTIDLSFQVRIDLETEPGTIIENVATLTGPVEKSSNRVTTIVNRQTGFEDVTINNAVSDSSAVPGDTLTYYTTITNTGPDVVDDIIVQDTIPDLVTFVPGSIVGDGTFTAPKLNNTMGVGEINWTIESLAPFASVDLEFKAVIDETILGDTVIYNRANIIAPGVVVGNRVATSVDAPPEMPQIEIGKSVERPSAMIGDMVDYTIIVRNVSSVTAEQIEVVDSMPYGMFYIEGTSFINRASSVDPGGDNPYRWTIGELEAGESVMLQYTVLIGAGMAPGYHENMAFAEAFVEGSSIRTPLVSARLNILSIYLPGSIRGRVLVDCDGDGVPETDSIPPGIDVYLDDGSRSQVNRKGMFYFSTVRAGERVVLLDERDLEGYYIPDGEPSSVFAHVHEGGESYINFRICPEYPSLSINKWAAMLPKVKVTKKASLDKDFTIDSSRVKVDYEIVLHSTGGADPAKVRVVDSLPGQTELVIEEKQEILPTQTDNTLTYEITAGENRIHKSVYYSLEDLAPGMRQFLTNKITLEGSSVEGLYQGDVVSEPTEVRVGPFKRQPTEDIKINIIGAYFKTAKADLQPQAIPQLTQIADSAKKYADADIRLEGHTDYRPINTREFPSNWELSDARAKSVADWLVDSAGIDSGRISYEGFADTRPVDTGHTEEAWQKNRRVEVFLKAQTGGGIDLSQIETEVWSSWTELALEPSNWDTVFTFPESAIVTGLNDGWEVFVLISNLGPETAKNPVFIDTIPSGMTYIDGSAEIDGESAEANIEGNIITIDLPNIDEQGRLEVRYRLTSDNTDFLCCGGRAGVKLITPSGEEVIQNSNPVTFPVSE